jgi:hypothetical protein
MLPDVVVDLPRCYLLPYDDVTATLLTNDNYPDQSTKSMQCRDRQRQLN